MIPCLAYLSLWESGVIVISVVDQYRFILILIYFSRPIKGKDRSVSAVWEEHSGGVEHHLEFDCLQVILL